MGHEAGYHETSSNKLYIANSRSNTLIYGDFSNGRVGIGTLNPDSKLTVAGTVHCEEVQVNLNVSPDYVFQQYYEGVSPLKADYSMPTLEEVEQFTREYHHLPGIPSAQEIEEEGLQLKEMTRLLLQKVEELTLYTIEQRREHQRQQDEIASLRGRLEALDTSKE